MATPEKNLEVPQVESGLIVKGFDVKEDDEATIAHLIKAFEELPSKYHLHGLIYPVGTKQDMAIAQFTNAEVAKQLVMNSEITKETELKFEKIEVDHQKEAIILDVSPILPIIPEILDKLPIKYYKVDDMKKLLFLDNQDTTKKPETYVNEELEKWLNNQLKDKEQFSLANCVIVTEFVKYNSHGETSDKLQITLQKRKLGGGDVHKVIYPFGNSEDKALAIFDESEVASSLINAKTILNESGGNSKISPFKIRHSDKAFTLELGEVAHLFDPTLKTSILNTVGISGEYLDDEQLVLYDKADVDKVIEYVSEQLEWSLASSVDQATTTTTTSSNIGVKEVAGISNEGNKELEYQFLTTCHKEFVNELEKKFDIIFTLEDNNFAIKSNTPGNDDDRKLAEDSFKSKYQSLNPTIKSLKVTNINVKKVLEASQETSREHNVLISPNEISFVGNEEHVDNAITYFQKLCGISQSTKHGELDTSRPRDDDGITFLDTKFVLPGGITVTVRQGDITEENVDVIVKEDNGQLQHESGVAKSIADKAGGRFQEEYKKKLERRKRYLTVTEVLHTAGYNLKAKYVIHAMGPNKNSHNEIDEKKHFVSFLENTFRNCLERATVCLEATSIAIPLISLGIFGGNKAECAQSLFNSILTFAKNDKRYIRMIKEIHLVNIDVEATSEIKDVFNKWQQSGKKTACQVQVGMDTQPNDVTSRFRHQQDRRSISSTEDPSYEEQNKVNSKQEKDEEPII